MEVVCVTLYSQVSQSEPYKSYGDKQSIRYQ